MSGASRVGRYAPHLAVLALMALTCAALYFGVDASLADRPGVRMTLPLHAGSWRGEPLRYCHAPACGKELAAGELADPDKCPACGAPLFDMSLVESELLPADTEYAKARYDMPGRSPIYVSVVLTGRDRESIHRPERCLEGQGNEVLGARVVSVPLAGRAPLKVTAMTAVRHVREGLGPSRDFPIYYAYWFVGQGRETPYHLERMFWLAWDRMVRGVAHRWAYVVVMGLREGEGNAYDAVMSEFIAAFYPQIALPPGAGHVPAAAPPAQ